MIAPGNSLIQMLFAVAFVIASGYAMGRIHQWYRDGAARDEAYRSGYDRASDCMLDMALRKRENEAAAAPAVLARAVRPDNAPHCGERLVAVPVTAGDAVPTRHLVGHARRRIVASKVSLAGPGTAAR
jgi:hypothetical protein